MKRLLVLLILAAALAGTAALLHYMREGGSGDGSIAESRDYVFPDLAVNKVEAVLVKDAEGQVTLERGEDRWTVSERGGYPANIDRVRQLVLDVEDLEVSGRQRVGESALAEVGLLRPGEAEDDEDTGLMIQLLAGSDVLADFVLGSMVQSSGVERGPMSAGVSQRLLRTTSDEDTVWLVSRTFNQASADPADWLNRSFFSVENPKSIQVMRPDADRSWSASRSDQDAEFDQLDEGNDLIREERQSGLRFLLTSPSFLDVIPLDQVTEDLMKGATRAVIETFDGFTYKIAFAENGNAEGETPTWFMTIEVEAEEQQEDEETIESESKLEAEQRLSDWVFEVSDFTVATLNRDREEMLSEAETTEPAEDSGDPATAGQDGSPKDGDRPVQQPQEPTEPAEPGDTSEPAEKPEESNEPMESEEPTEPAEPGGAGEPSEQPEEPTEPAESEEPAETTEPGDAGEPSEQPEEPTEPAESEEPAEATEPGDAGEPSEQPEEPTEPAESEEPAESDDSTGTPVPSEVLESDEAAE